MYFTQTKTLLKIILQALCKAIRYALVQRTENDFKWKFHNQKERYEIRFEKENRTEHENA